MQAFQKALDGFWSDIAGHVLLEVFEDLGITIFELAVRLFAAGFPPVLRKLREEGLFEATIWKIPSFGNLCFALPQPLGSQLGVSLAGTLPNDGAPLLPRHRISDVGDSATQKDAPVLRLHVLPWHLCFL